ncbi:MAG: TIGR04283 family arsenosugar biosynthesis glycosyltransferase [Nitrospinaceae bacterium]|jgi:rSAM/selenodomain-associated transferase 2|nr:MAG: TIGR04283 family arsenosugar biosynthesis glycosyltransferase [Nitrospinaceae bacterium]
MPLLRRRAKKDAPLKISVVIPTLNEAKALPESLKAVHCHRPHEVIVADGGSDDGTQDIARRAGCRVVCSPPGRAAQMNAGALAASGEVVLFLHADSRVSEKCFTKMAQAMNRDDRVGGAFSLSIESDLWSLRLISTLATLRSRYLHLVYGDQAIFVRARAFHELGGFSPLPICEDLDFFRRLKNHGPVVLLREKTVTSARRWRAEGVFFTTARNIAIASLFLLGCSPKILSRWYLVIR